MANCSRVSVMNRLISRFDLGLSLVKKKPTSREQCLQRGFSLLEVVIALMIFIVLMVVSVDVVKNQRGYDHLLDNQHYMAHVKEAFITFVKVNRFLPCPDTDGDGKENREGAPNFECTFRVGTVPFLELGVPATDAWHQPLLYAVNEKTDMSGTLEITDPLESASYFNSQSAPVFGWNTLPIGVTPDGGNYRVCGELTDITTGCSTATNNAELLETSAIAMVVSFGENGNATWNAINNNLSGDSIGLDEAEIENMDGDQDYWKAVGSQREGQKFDDSLFWLLGTDIKYAVVSSGGTL